MRPTACPIDVALAALPFEEELIERSSLFEFEAGAALRTCSAEVKDQPEIMAALEKLRGRG